MDKQTIPMPTSMRINVLKNGLVTLINTSNLPPYIVEPILKDLHTEVHGLAEEQARKEELIENLKQPTQDFSEFAKGEANKEKENVADTIIADGNDLKTNNSDDEDDLPF